MTARRWLGAIAIGAGALLVVGSFVWRGVAVPALVRFPTDLDVTPEYSGTFTLAIDPVTHLPLDKPATYPLAVTRHIEADGAASSKQLVVVKEDLHLVAQGLFDFGQHHQYVMDRRTMRNVKDGRAWAFTPDNVVDRSPDYRLNFPFDTQDRAYPVYKNETAATYQATPAGTTSKIEGLTARDFHASTEPTPVVPAYLASLDQAVTLPRQLTITELKPVLASAGLDIDASLPGLLAVLSPQDTATVAKLASASVDLTYELSFSGTDSIEPYTGSTLEVRDVTETLTARPSGDTVTTLQSILEKYPDNTEAKAGLGAIRSLAANPIKVFTNAYSQTEASVRDIARTVKDQRDKRRLAERTIPDLALIVGLVLIVVGVVLVTVRGRRRLPHAPARTVDDTAGEP
jgi:Porin PorA